jgi:hypothetical protein
MASSGATLNFDPPTALTYFAHSYIKIHRTLPMSPAMAAGDSDRMWNVEYVVPSGEPMESRGRMERRKWNLL